MTSIRYRDLNKSIHEFRLVRLLPSITSQSGSIHCTIEYTSLAHPPPYTALSYVWGDPKDVRAIVVNGSVCKARANLVNALHELRRSNVDRLWIDALCINQHDEYEKGDQIALIGTIYKLAEKVIAWLGNNPEAYDKAFQLMAHLEKTAPTRKKPHPRPMRAIEMGKYLDPEYRQSLLEFFENPYWTRVWIIQEIAFGDTVELACGSRRFSLGQVSNTVSILRKYVVPDHTAWRKAAMNQPRYLLGYDSPFQPPQGHHLIEDPIFHHICTIIDTRYMTQKAEPADLVTLMARSVRAESTNPMDQAYGLFGLAYDNTKIVPLPNYLIDVSELWLRIATVVVRTHFHFIPIFGNSSENLQEPTWVPEWHARSLRLKHYRRLRLLGRFVLSETWNGIDQPSHYFWRFRTLPKPEVTIQGRTLKARGLRLGTISSVSSTLEEAVSQGSTYVRMPETMSAMRETGSVSNSSLFSALYYLFTSRRALGLNPVDVDWSSYSEVVDFRHIFSDHKYEPLRRAAPDVSAWLEINRSLNIHGRTLENRIMRPQGMSDHLEYFGVGFELYGHLNKPDVCNAIPTIISYALCFSPRAAVGVFKHYSTRTRHGINEQILQRMHRRLSMGMRLSAYGDSLAWVDASARPGDQLAYLHGCNIPVVLRARNQGGWNVVGAAMIPKWRDASDIRKFYQDANTPGMQTLFEIY